MFDTKYAFGLRFTSCICVFLFFFFFFCLMHTFQEILCTVQWVVHYSRDPQVFYSEKKKENIKNGSYNIIHIFKNYFATVFSIFSKISGIQTNPKLSNFWEYTNLFEKLKGFLLFSFDFMRVFSRVKNSIEKNNEMQRWCATWVLMITIIFQKSIVLVHLNHTMVDPLFIIKTKE